MRKIGTTTALICVIICSLSLYALGYISNDGSSREQVAPSDLSVQSLEKRSGTKSLARVFKAPLTAVRKLFGKGRGKSSNQALTANAPLETEASSGDADSITLPPSAGSPRTPPHQSEIGVSLEEPGPSVPSLTQMREAAERSADPLTRGKVLLRQNRLDEAIGELSIAAATVGPDLLEANILLGIVYDRKGMHSLAREAYERVLRASPDNVKTLSNLGTSLYLSGDREGALRHLRKATRLAPQDRQILHNLAVVEYRTGRYDDAYKSFARLGNTFAAYLSAAMRSEETGNLKEAIKQYELALKASPSSATVLERLAKLYRKTGARDEAVAALQTFSQRGG